MKISIKNINENINEIYYENIATESRDTISPHLSPQIAPSPAPFFH